MSSKSNHPSEQVEVEDDNPQATTEDSPDTDVELEDANQEADYMTAELAQAQQKASENWDLYVRAQAEMENLRRRAERDLENAHKYAVEKFVMELLPIKDSLELGLSAAVNAGSDKLREGTELTLKMFNQTLEKFAVAEVNPVGEPFDPNLHQAMTMQVSTEHEPNTVISVMQKGYTLKDRLLRPAMVIVSKTEA